MDMKCAVNLKFADSGKTVKSSLNNLVKGAQKYSA